MLWHPLTVTTMCFGSSYAATSDLKVSLAVLTIILVVLSFPDELNEILQESLPTAGKTTGTDHGGEGGTGTGRGGEGGMGTGRGGEGGMGRGGEGGMGRGGEGGMGTGRVGEGGMGTGRGAEGRMGTGRGGEGGMGMGRVGDDEEEDGGEGDEHEGSSVPQIIRDQGRMMLPLVTLEPDTEQHVQVRPF